MSETKSELREPAYWAHKARALLLPTPLASVDPNGEEERARWLLEWLGSDVQWREPELFDRSFEDALGVHVPGDLVSHAVDLEDEVPLPPLLHPLSGESPARKPDAKPSDDALSLDELRCSYQRWIEELLGDRQAPCDARAYAELWRQWLRSLEQPEHRRLGRLPGHALVRDHSVFSQRTIAAALVGARFDGESHPCLLCVHCGPVQSFIGAARRTSDLWLGSYLVNLLSYQAVHSIADLCGPDSILYPHLATLPLAERDADPQLIQEATLEQRLPWLRAAQPNRFVALVDSAHAVKIAEQAASAVHLRWRDMADRVRRGVSQSFDPKEGFAGFEQQIDEQVEVDIVVQPWPNTVDEVAAMLGEAERGSTDNWENVGEYYGDVFTLGRHTLGAQRDVHTFMPSKGDARPKCTQCGQREQLGPEFGRRAQRKWWKELREGLRRKGSRKGQESSGGTVEFREGEALCGVCLTKRLVHRFDLAGSSSEFGLRWHDKEHRALLRFPSVASVASAPFRSRLAEYTGHEAVRAWLGKLAALDRVLDFDPPGNLLPGLGPIGRRQKLLTVDGTWLYARSYEPDTVARDFDRDRLGPDQEASVRDATEAFKRVRAALAEGEEDPIRATAYYAVVMIDVDRMGKWLDGTFDKRPTLRDVIENAKMISRGSVHQNIDKDRKRAITSALHAEVSRRQGQLSSCTLHEVVERHLGRVVYSGGDDLLAFLPLHTVWACLAEIERAFRADDALGSRVTISAGVAISDWRAPLSLALKNVRDAEKRAKMTRDRVAITLDVRSGAPIELVLRWGPTGELPALVERLAAPETSAGEHSSPPLLRPSAVDQLRRELDQLRHEGLEDAFSERTYTLLGGHDHAPPWFRRLINERTASTLGQVVTVLLLLRFLARERGGIEFSLTPSKEVGP